MGFASALPILRPLRRTIAFSRRISPELCFNSPPSNPRGRREGRVPARTRGPLREKRTQKEPHSSIQVVPITRPSLRGGRTAYAVLSREPNFPSGLPRPANWMMQSARLGSRTSSKGLTVATTARTTRFCRTHGPPCRRSISNPVDGAAKLTGETKPSSAARPHAVSGSQGLPAPPVPSRADAAASTASPARDQDDLEIAPLQ